MSATKLKLPRPFRLHEEGGPASGFVGMGLFGLCGYGADRQSAWNDLVRQIDASAIRVVDAPAEEVS